MNIKQFFAALAGSFIGVWSAIILFFVLTVISMVIFIAAFSFKSSKTFTTEKDSVLYLNLAGSIPERTTEDIFTVIFNTRVSGSSLEEILKSIEYAKSDNNIKGIYIDCNVSVGGLASLYEIRRALDDFKKSGKWIYAYGDFIEQGDYYVASVADSIYLNPVGAANIRGLSTTTPYFKNMLDKLGIEMQIIKVGNFKSAVEPFILTQMSEADRLQKEVYLGSMWNNISSAISKSRNIPLPKLNQLADSMLLTKPSSYLLKNKIIDGICYKNEFIDKLKRLTKIDESDDLRLVSPSDLILSSQSSVKTSANEKIAVIYAVGEINSADENGIVAEDIVDDVLSLAKDDDIKGLVMRVNSPGGSAFDSEQIWAALEEFKKSGKPYAVSMGNVAASGGYYISCGADKIFAEPLTLTGSIGIFGMIPCFKDLMQDKIGINTSYVMTNENSNFPSVMRRMTPAQARAMQNMVNEGYEIFTRRCAEGRHISQDSIKAIGGGRVWDGLSALKLGLVDEIGGIKDAVEWVASSAGIENYSITILPAEKNIFDRYFSKYVISKIQKAFVSPGHDEIFKYSNDIKKILSLDPVQCRMDPVEIN